MLRPNSKPEKGIEAAFVPSRDNRKHWSGSNRFGRGEHFRLRNFGAKSEQEMSSFFRKSLPLRSDQNFHPFPQIAQSDLV